MEIQKLNVYCSANIIFQYVYFNLVYLIHTGYIMNYLEWFNYIKKNELNEMNHINENQLTIYGHFVWKVEPMCEQ